ncbi:MAG: hypothetical protein KDJ37_12565 [Hyphomicrobiaceae bacterium]|nr:hypothetical protein [Hyphomicrobiaceae bacterium]
MHSIFMPSRAIAALALLIAIPAMPLNAEEKASVSSSLPDSELTPEERAEREQRKACKVAICGGFRNPGAGEGEVRCSVLKSWRKTQLDKMTQKAKVSWPWGAVRCNADIVLDRAALAKAMTEASYEMKLATHAVACTIDREKKDDAKISFEFTPTVSFAQGKATKAKLHWGKIDAPTLVKGAMWTATATDNTFNVLQSTLVDDINDFIGKKCDEVKDDWSKPAQ